MAKTAGKKKATSAHRKVQSATTRSRKNVKRTTNVKKAVSTKKKQTRTTGSRKTTQGQKKETEQAKLTVQVEQTQAIETTKVTEQSQQTIEQVQPTTEQVQSEVTQTSESQQETVQGQQDAQAAETAQTTGDESKLGSLIETIIPVPVIDHKAPEIILHNSKRTDLLETEIEQTVEAATLQSKEETVIEPIQQNQQEQQATQSELTENTTLAQEITQSERDVEDVLQEVIEKQEQATETTQQKQTAQDLKDSAIEKALVEASNSKSRREKDRRSRRRVHFGFRRVVLALACAAAAVFAIVYFVNLNTPDVSLKVAAMQSGIDAKYPSYVPRDYNLSDITSESGKITLNFRNPTTGDAFTIIEEKSSWDSSTLLTNYVRGAFGDDYSQIEEQGLTLFVNGSDAAWVNGGVVYKLRTTSGSLTKKQIKSIATSL